MGDYLICPVWIPITECLPEPGTTVLAAFDDGEVSTVHQEWKTDGPDSLIYKGFMTNDHDQTVTHWACLPTPPVTVTRPQPRLFGSSMTLIEPDFAQLREGLDRIEAEIEHCAASSDLDPASVRTWIVATRAGNVALVWKGRSHDDHP